LNAHSSVSLCCIPVPVVPQAVNDVLTIQKPDGESGITVEVRWPLMMVNQQSTLHVFGQNTDGTPRVLLVADAEPVTEQEVEQGWSRPVLWEQLQGLKEGSDLISVFKVTQGDSACVCPVLFPPLSLKVEDRAVPEIHHENFDDQPNLLISVGETIDLPALKMKVRLLSGQGKAGIFTFVGPVPTMLEGPALAMSYALDNANPEQHLWVDFRESYTRVQFAYTYNHRPASVIVYDEYLNVIEELHFDGEWNGGQRHHWVDVSAPVETRIAHVEFVQRDYAFADFFTMWK
jgi:hypothetical protein